MYRGAMKRCFLNKKGDKTFFFYQKGLFMAIDPQVSPLNVYPPPRANGPPKGNC